MSSNRSREPVARTLASRCAQLYRLVLSTFFLIPLTSAVARVRGGQEYQSEKVTGTIWRHRQDSLTHEGILLKLERAFYRLVIVPLVAFLPAPLAYGVACLQGDLRSRWETSRREQAMSCLESVLGDQLSPSERVRVTRDFFRLRACYPIDVTRLAGSGRALRRLVEIRGLEHIEAALTAGKGAILCGAHFGSFNCSSSLIGACGYPITIIGRWASTNLSNKPSLERFLYRLTDKKLLQRHRRRPNIEPLGQMKIAVQVATILRQNELISVAIDAPLLFTEDRTRGVPMDFLNGQALLLPGATTIAQLLGTPVLMVFMRRSPDWRHQVLEISSPVLLDGDAVTAFRRCLAALEKAIRENPAHWAFWDFFTLVALGLLPERE